MLYTETLAPGAPLHSSVVIHTHADFHSRLLDNRRTLLVLLPPGYDADPLRRYPVLYLHDGQNLFDGATAYVHGQYWRVGETAQALIAAQAIEPLIIVGIYHMGAGRVAEYTPSRDERIGQGGQAQLYGRMLVEELKPYVDAHYRTRAGAEDTGLGGSSLGGLVSLFTGLRYPATFGKLAALSPSVFWDERLIVRRVAALHAKLPLRIWLDTGTSEGRYATEHARSLRDALVHKGWTLDAELNYFEAVGATHDENAWAARVAPMLKFLFPA
ncbi:MAG TPA: alpha/beta hydrolase-fold protein [Pyrinomonadaceae bacterium]